MLLGSSALPTGIGEDDNRCSTECSTGDMVLDVAEGTRCLATAVAANDAKRIYSKTLSGTRVLQMWHNGGGMAGKDLSSPGFASKSGILYDEFSSRTLTMWKLVLVV
ncbi:unnamed protein product [Urochloa humidicola]